MPASPFPDGPEFDRNEKFPADPFEQQKRAASIIAEEARFALPEKYRHYKPQIDLVLASITDHEAYLKSQYVGAAKEMMQGIIRLNKLVQRFQKQGETLDLAGIDSVFEARHMIVTGRYMLAALEASKTLPRKTEPATPAERVRYLLEVLSFEYSEAGLTELMHGPLPPILQPFADAMVAGMAAHKISTTGARQQVGKALSHEYQGQSDPLIVHLLTAVASRSSENIRDSELVAFLHELRREVDRLGERYERDRKREVYDLPLENVASTEETLFGGFENEALIAALQTATETLSPSEQEVINLYFYEGKTQAEVAWIRGTSEKTVSVQSSNAIKKLREALRQQGYKV